MMNGGLKYQIAKLNIAEKLIALNVLVFLINGLSSALLGFSGQGIVQWFELPEDFFSFLKQPWSLITYSFFHAGIWHLFWNMLMLYFTSRFFLNLFNPKRFLNVYFLGVILGGLLFMLSYNIFPTLTNRTVLVGASAGVTAVLIFICAYLPNQEVRVLFFNVKLWHVGVFFVVVDLLQIATGDNIGGRIAHLGGAALGYVYAKQLAQGNDIGAGFGKIINAIENLFKRKEKKAPLKTVYKNKAKTTNSKTDYDKKTHQRKIDDILDKISKSGYESLSKSEKDFLFKAGKED